MSLPGREGWWVHAPVRSVREGADGRAFRGTGQTAPGVAQSVVGAIV
ncbi:hypothetical protein EHYA_03631 [Embleya hyalina]|uniref:Uncharacterized protein n=1 Tax=Embleya hyalina TaxID=516124 RepID=A0A401YN00_9ACTN|nr:hypothetical protein EHYA_03631 [Embleya hyalina]